MEKRFGKKDVIFLAAAGLLLLCACVLFYSRGKEGAVVTVTVNGSLYGTYSLEQDQTVEIKIDGAVTNVLSIQNKKADMLSANCPDLLCVHQKAVSKEHETIVCLPNQVVVEVVGGEKAELDSVT